jgi:dienelactone hydrolase
VGAIVKASLAGWTLRREAAASVILVLLAIATGVTASSAASGAEIGPVGPEGPRMREQIWRLPSADPGHPLLATVFRPAADALLVAASGSSAEPKRPLVVINHGTDTATRRSMGMPVFYWLTRWFVERGYVVALPLRRGYGATGGPFLEGRDNCADPDHRAAGEAAADDIAASIAHLRTQPFVDPDNVVVVGISSGGWASLALAARNPAGVRLVVNFAGGRGAYAWGRPRAICGHESLVAASSRFAETSRIPTLWLYAENDSYFPPPVAEAMHRAWTARGGQATLHVVPSYRSEGHELVNGADGWALWSEHLGRFLAAETLLAAKPAASGTPALPVRQATLAPGGGR